MTEVTEMTDVSKVCEMNAALTIMELRRSWGGVMTRAEASTSPITILNDQDPHLALAGYTLYKKFLTAMGMTALDEPYEFPADSDKRNLKDFPGKSYADWIELAEQVGPGTLTAPLRVWMISRLALASLTAIRSSVDRFGAHVIVSRYQVDTAVFLPLPFVEQAQRHMAQQAD